MTSESCSSPQDLSNDIFVCSKKLKTEEFSKIPPAPRILKNFKKSLRIPVYHKISFRMVYNLSILTILVMELLQLEIQNSVELGVYASFTDSRKRSISLVVFDITW